MHVWNCLIGYHTKFCESLYILEAIKSYQNYNIGGNTMAFKSIVEYDAERFDNLFMLRNDGDHADVIFMYGSQQDALIANVHYIKSYDYTGYVHCCGRGCPACEKGIRTQTKLFIPLYNLSQGEIQFWDRSIRFENQLISDVFSRYPNPSEFVFRITRHGASGDTNTKYTIMAVGKNVDSSLTIPEILKAKHTTSPEYYSNICKEFSSDVLASMLSVNSSNTYDSTDELIDYQVKPRISTAVSSMGAYVPETSGASESPVMTQLNYIVDDENADNANAPHNVSTQASIDFSDTNCKVDF